MPSRRGRSSWVERNNPRRKKSKNQYSLRSGVKTLTRIRRC